MTTAAADMMAVAPRRRRQPPLGKVVVETRRIGEDSIGLAYAGRWKTARHNGYSGQTVLYARPSGATVTYPFYAKSVAWVGPVGPTRGNGEGRDRRQGRRDGRPAAEQVQAAGRSSSAREARRHHTIDDHGRRQRPAGRDRRVRHHALTLSPCGRQAPTGPPRIRRAPVRRRE